MKYYKLYVKRFYDNDMIATNANGSKIANGDNYFWRMDKGEIIIDAPTFDYFYLESFDKKEYWDWILCDVYNFIGESSQIPGWLISKKLKEILEKYKIAEPHFYYLSKLLYQEQKLDYYIFQFSGKDFRLPLTNYIDFNKSLFYDPNHKIDFTVSNEKELLFQQEKILEESGFDVINVPIKKLFINDDIHFISMQNFLGDKIVSEKLKQSLEENGIIGFEFSELEYEIVVEKY
ncbi:hypothetical protein PG291_10200 [Riemerella anatipestifer]|nr:hypothetical protein [Riemerella anatipestifer]